MTAISLADVGKTYEGNSATLRAVNLHIESGEFCVFLGPSGCGKSTLLRMIAGLENISTGELRIGGTRMNETPPAARKVAMVFQNYALYPHMSVAENMGFALQQARVPKAEISQRVTAAGEILQIGHLLDKLPRQLSGGQRQRVAIGRAIVRKPDVFLFDEPLSNLDAALRVHMRSEIGRLHREVNHASAVYVTHDQTEAMALADRIVLLHAGADMERHGSIAQHGSPLELYHRPRNRFVAGFLGSPRMNFINAVLIFADAAGCTVRLVDGETLTLPLRAGSLAPGASLSLGIRPEHLALASERVPGGLSRPARLIERFGEFAYVYLTGSDGETLIAKVDGDLQADTGELLHFAMPAARCHLFDADGFALAPVDDTPLPLTFAARAH